jgi:hypothetical protein
MKKIFLKALFMGGVLSCTIVGNTSILAADSLTGKTTVTAKTTAGDVTLAINNKLDFGDQQLSDLIDFGSKEITYHVTDYSGDTNGYSLQARVEDSDANRMLKVNSTDISAVGTVDSQGNSLPPITIDSVKTDIFGINPDKKVTISLKYSNLKEKSILNTTIDWILVKGSVTP